MSAGVLLSFASFATVVSNIAWYYPKMTGNRAPLKPRVEQVVMALGLILAIAAFFLNPGVIGILVGIFAILPATLFLLATFTSGLPQKALSVAVGERAPDFIGTDADGKPFRLADLRGSAVLLKFYRGYWCPYCVAELDQLDRHRAELQALGVRLVAVSADRVDELRSFKRRHHWAITLVADPDIAIQRLYNVQQRNYTPKRGLFREMAIPTTVLIDKGGTVRWIDQAIDFRVRSQAPLVLAKVRALLAEATPAATEECAVCAA